MMTISPADLPLNSDGSVYHLHLLPEDIADTLIFVGDPNRAQMVADYFDRIEVHKTQRELVTFTGYLGSKRLSVIGTGMGAGNIDIILNELDALANIDLQKREPKPTHKALNIIRLGTGGGLQPELSTQDLVVAKYSVGFDALMHFYNSDFSPQEKAILEKAQQHFAALNLGHSIYANQASEKLFGPFTALGKPGITLTTAGFFGPQARHVRAELIPQNTLTLYQQFKFENLQAANLEMETAAIYGLCRLLGHHCVSISAVIANRATNAFNSDYPAVVKKMIEQALEIIAEIA